MVGLHPKLQVLWYLVAVGCVVSLAPLIYGIDMIKLEYHSEPISEDDLLDFTYQSDSLYSFTRSQYLYSYESLFVFRAIQFLAIAVVCFFVSFILTILCLVIEACKNRISSERMQVLVCSLQYLRLFCGSESFLLVYIIFYFEIERITKTMMLVEAGDVDIFLSVKFTLIPGTWFMMTWMVNQIAVLNFFAISFFGLIIF